MYTYILFNVAKRKRGTRNISVLKLRDGNNIFCNIVIYIFFFLSYIYVEFYISLYFNFIFFSGSF